ncbi:MAG: sulfide/dihydroorotate dehydrogenase-like FAD/NAD-binding protein, partial [Dehalococcoidia bacterium]
MYVILSRDKLAPGIHVMRIAAPAVARKAQAGQFVIIRVDERGERIPLTIADWDRDEGSVTIVFMEAGKTTRQLATLEAGDSLA